MMPPATMKARMTVLADSVAGAACRFGWAMRAMALAVVVSLLMALPPSGTDGHPASASPHSADAGAPGTAFGPGKPSLDVFSLPREFAAAPLRQASGDPPPPVSVPGLVVRPETDAAWVALVDVGRTYVAPPSQSGAWASLRTPAGPPAAG